ncbi:MAG TPA: nitroreductase family protein, partial [Denitromonas sp.]|nr:nitroreductase family protein [Denitromonas sp.]
MADRDTLLKILDLARWAPSGDNTQPWRFEIVSDTHIAIHGHDTRDWCVYDFEGHASHMAHGALLETLRIAATAHGLEARWQLRTDSRDSAPVYDVSLSEHSDIALDPLLPYIERRTVQRRPMRTTPLTAAQREALAAAVGADYQLQTFESTAERWMVAKLLWRNAYIRLTCPEAYAVHREVIEWGARYSEDRIPEAAVGVDPLTASLMRWVMASWSRIEFFNRYLLGTVAPRIQLDLIPAMACAAHLLLRPKAPLVGVEDYVRLGEAMQRVWLTATSVGLHLQPEMTPVIFRWYVRAGRPISKQAGIDDRADALTGMFERMVGALPEDA